LGVSAAGGARSSIVVVSSPSQVNDHGPSWGLLRRRRLGVVNGWRRRNSVGIIERIGLIHRKNIA
jgi:hypothetical protein